MITFKIDLILSFSFLSISSKSDGLTANPVLLKIEK